MDMGRRTAIKAGGAAALAATTSQAQAADTANPLAAFIAADGSAIKAVQVSVGADGKTGIADADIPADNSPYPLFKQFLTHKASATAIYAAPPHHKIVGTKNDAKEILFIVAGETTLKAGGTVRKCPAGSVILLDAGSGAGLAEQAGPEGYTGVKVQLAD